MIETYSDEGCDGSPSLVYEGEEGMRKASTSSSEGPKSNYVLFPNPASEQLNVYSPLEKESLILEIKDVTNKLLYRESLPINNHNVTIKLNLLNGIYFVSLIPSDGKPTIQKLVISK